MTELLEQLVPVRRERAPDWNDVLRRAGVHASQSGEAPAKLAPRRRRVMLAIAVAVLVVAGTAIGGLGRDAFDGLSSWLRGEPGTPASASEQAGFAARNASSYAAFPADTKLRLLQRQQAGGVTFSLLGFRSGSSLCLRLIRSDRPSARGGNECVTLRELRSSAAPALVASEAYFRGNPKTSVHGIFGFADDTVREIELRHLGGRRRTAKVSSNVFLALEASRSGTVADHAPFDPIVQVKAMRESGAPVVVPFIAQDMGDYGAGVPSRPSYLKPPGLVRPGDVPGPTRIEAPFQGGTVGWIERREERGEAWAPEGRTAQFFGTVLFSRAVQPDPDDPLRIGISLARVDRQSRVGRTGRTGVMLCASDLRPLAPRETGASCVSPDGSGLLFRSGQPLIMSWMAPSQISRVTGLAADQVAKIDVYLSSGRVVPAALRDNAFTFSVPTAQMPAKVVVRDHRGRVIWINVLGGSAIPTPCPPAALGNRSSSPSGPRPYERIDLATRTVNGSKVLGRSPGEIGAALGRPDRIAYPKEPTYYYGGHRDGSASLIVRFGRRQGRLRAISFTYQGRTLVDARLGNLLAMQPVQLQRRLERVHGSTFRRDFAYGSIPGRGCLGGFVSRLGRAELTFGLHAFRRGRPFVTLSHGY